MAGAVSEMTSLMSKYISFNNKTDNTTYTNDEQYNNGITKNNLGTFFGVYVPTILGTFGVVIFLRLSWITGQAGALNTILMYLIGYTVVGLTVLSVSAVATNGEMKAGGTYYLISRALGPEFGGSLGVIFFVANITGCAFFILGFVEAFTETFGLETSYSLNFWYGTISLFVVAVIVIVGANLFAKTSFLIFVLLLFSILFAFISYFFQTDGVIEGYTGPSIDTFSDNLHAHYGEDEHGNVYTWRILFGILFPSVTGLMTGSNLSGDLADPAKSLPIGTLGAGVTTFCIYIGLVLSFSTSIQNHVLSVDQYVTQHVAFAEWVIVMGIFSAISSSALATLISAARILQALARDNIFPLGFFAVGSRKGDEPRRGVVLCWALVQVLLLVPKLDILAPYIAMLYLLSFSITNLACFVSDVAGLPNFRPAFKYYHWSTALVGAISSLIVMFIIDPVDSGMSFFVMIVLWLFIHFRAPSVQWGDISQALIYHQVRKYLLRLDVRKIHVKIWRPGVLLLVSSPRGLGTPHLIDATNSLKKGGLFVVGNVLVGQWKHKLRDQKTMYQLWLDLIIECKWKMFIELIIAPSVRLGIQSLVLASGVGGMKPNTVVLGFFDPNQSVQGFGSPSPTLPPEIAEKVSEFPNKPEQAMTVVDYVAILKDINRAGKNLIVARNFEKLDKADIIARSGRKKYLFIYTSPGPHIMTIDAWIIEDYAASSSSASTANILTGADKHLYSDTSALIVQLAYILHTAAMWCKYTTLRVLTYTSNDQLVADERERLQKFLHKCRVRAEIVVLSPADFQPESTRAKTYNTILKRNSSNTSISFFPLPQLPVGKPKYAELVEEITVLSAGVGPVYLVRANEKVLSDEI